MKAAVISLGSTSSLWTIESLKKYFDVVDKIDIRNIEVNLAQKESVVLYQGKKLEHYDCIYAKGSFRYNPLLRALTTILCKDSYMPITPSAFTIGHDKLLTQLILITSDIPMPKTYIAATPASAKLILEKINFPLIMKFPEGTQGKGVMFADSFASANSMLDALSALKQPFIIQEYIDTGGADIRAFVIGDKVIAAMRRQAIENEKRANIHAGGKGTPLELDDNIKKIAIKTAHTIGADICAVDILEGPKGPLVIEVNLSPGLQGIMATTKIDIADQIAKFLHEKTQEFCGRDKTEGTKKILDNVGIKGTDTAQHIVTNLDFRSGRMLLPQLVTKISGFEEEEEVIVESKKGKIYISKM